MMTRLSNKKILLKMESLSENQIEKLYCHVNSMLFGDIAYHESMEQSILNAMNNDDLIRKKALLWIRKEQSPTQPMTKTRIYTIHVNMMSRCYKTYNTNYSNYGGRGIKVCKEWHDFKNFKEWAINNGYRYNLTLDRKNNDGDYHPDNCRWADLYQQANNTSTNHKVEINGITHTLAEWGRISNLDYTTIRYRINAGWPTEFLLKPTFKSGGVRRSQHCPQTKNKEG